MVKKVDIPELLLNNYSNGEIVHYLAAQLRNINNTELSVKEWNEFNFGAVMTDIQHLYIIAAALDKKMNGSEDTNIVL